MLTKERELGLIGLATLGIAERVRLNRTTAAIGGPEWHAYKAAIEAVLEGNATRDLPLSVWAKVLAADARGW